MVWIGGLVVKRRGFPFTLYKNQGLKSQTTQKKPPIRGYQTWFIHCREIPSIHNAAIAMWLQKKAERHSESPWRLHHAGRSSRSRAILPIGTKLFARTQRKKKNKDSHGVVPSKIDDSPLNPGTPPQNKLPIPRRHVESCGKESYSCRPHPRFSCQRRCAKSQ